MKSMLAADASVFDGKTVIELGAGTGILCIWMWAVMRARSDAATAASGSRGKSKPAAAAPAGVSAGTSAGSAAGAVGAGPSTASSVSAFSAGSEVVVTDLDECMELLKENVDTNVAIMGGENKGSGSSNADGSESKSAKSAALAPASCSLHARCLPWGESVEDALGASLPRTYDYVVATDCMYNPKLFSIFVKVRASCSGVSLC
jgi:predicted nicotinamide N-methyase